MRRCLHHDVWKGPLSDKYDPPLNAKAGRRGLHGAIKNLLHRFLVPCYQLAHVVGWVALAERLLTQLLSSRSEKYECTHILITKLDVPAGIYIRIFHPKNTVPLPQDLPTMLTVCDGDVFSTVRPLVLTGATSPICLARQEKSVSTPQAHQKSRACVHGTE